MGTTTTEIDALQPRDHDQRLTLRKRLTQPIPIQLFPGKQVWLQDLGEGGLSVSGTSPLELGTTTSACFRLAEANSVIDAAGVVAWSDDSGRLGVRFTRVEPDSTAALRRWVKNGAIVASESSTMTHPPDAELATRISCLSEVADLQSVISTEQFDCDAALNLIVRRMMELTRATGCAIALREGQDVVCRARAGNAPDVGVRLSPTSLSGECFRTGAIVMLEDSESDPRVNAELCRQLDFRSLLVLPITSGADIMGIAEVLSPNPSNFAGGDVLVMSFLADLITTVATPRLEPDRSSVPTATPFPVFDDVRDWEESPANERPNLELQASPVVTEGPSVELPMVVAALVEETPAPAQPIEVRNTMITPAVAEITRPVISPIARKAALSRKTMSRWIPFAATFVVLLATAALLAGYYFSRSASPSKAVSTISTTGSSPANTTTTSPQSSLPASAVPVSNASSRRVDSKPTSASQVRPNLAPETTKAAPVPAAELQVTHAVSHRLDVNAENSAAPEAPAFGAIASRGPGLLPASIVAAKTATPELQRPAESTGVIQGRLIKRVMPRYPEMARTAGVSGDVILTAKITTEGTLRDLRVVSGSPLLREAAIEAARQWRYTPYKLGNMPVETETRITISFHR